MRFPLVAAGLVFLTGWLGSRVGAEKSAILSSAAACVQPDLRAPERPADERHSGRVLLALSATLAMTVARGPERQWCRLLPLAMLTRPNLTPLGLPLARSACLPTEATSGGTTGRGRWRCRRPRCGAAIAAVHQYVHTERRNRRATANQPACTAFDSCGHPARYSGWLSITET